VRWRTQAVHHGAQEKGRFEVFGDYHLRVGELEGSGSTERTDATEVGAGTVVTLIDSKQPTDRVKDAPPAEIAAALGLRADAAGLVAWDLFEAILSPGDVLLMMTARDQAAAQAMSSRDGARLRRVRILRDYGMFDRREAPQYYPDVTRR
jgi:hypothetical protein